MRDKLKIGIIGLGTVGSGVFKTLKDFGDEVEIVKIATKDLSKAKGVTFENIVEDAADIVNNPEIDVVVEVAGGVAMLDFLKTAIKNGKHIVTANKELLAKHGAELFDLANEHDVVILYEAAIAGGIPIISPIKTALRANKFKKIAGILNGTTNYILTKMEENKISYQECLKDAQDLGYAEADPTGDVDGYDTMYKIATLANIVFHKRIDVNKIYREGITKITDDDIDYANDLGYKIKLIGLAQATDSGIDIRVHPMLVKKENIISGINNAINAVLIDAFPVGEVVFTGAGAGEFPTASSVVGDILAISSEFQKCSKSILPMTRCHHSEPANQIDISETKNSYYISIKAQNKTGTIGMIGTACGKNNISLSSVLQKGLKPDGTAQIVAITEVAKESDVQNALKEMQDNGIVINNLIRVME